MTGPTDVDADVDVAAAGLRAIAASVWDSTENQALDDAAAELHIAADRWSSFPDDEDVVAALHQAVATYRAARTAFVDLVATGGMPTPAACPSCGHTHATEGMAAICIGCPCQEGGS